MAIWQFGFYLIPEAGILRTHGYIPSKLEQYKLHSVNSEIKEEDEFINYWLDFGIPMSIKRRIAKILPEVKSWSADAEMYGYDEGSKIEIWSDDIICFIDARKNELELLELLAEIANSLECKIILKDNGKVIHASYPTLLKEFKKSVAKQFVSNPRETLIMDKSFMG